MKQKRQAASEIFAKQYVQQADEQDGGVEELAAASADIPKMKARKARAPMPDLGRVKTSEELQLEKEPIHVRETGFWRWKRVIVPPNAYVVHTRIGQREPITLGLGLSFRYNPYSDAYLVVPSAMQTIGVVANCITKEKQGINILAYLQWQIDDFSVAYRKLDFSDQRDPLGIVNAQLGEQAEAAIKDKISTMSVEEVLTDKAPVIEELTTRLKAVAEGREQEEESTGHGLGIKIITVQIREALVSSQRLWTDLQAPFRHEQEQKARVSHLTMQSQIRRKELETQQANETREAETMVEIERIKQSKETEASNLRVAEELTRFDKEQEAGRQKIQLEEQTSTVRQESQQRLETQAANIAQERALNTLKRDQEKAIEETKLNAEAATQRKSLEIEGELHALQEEDRLNERQNEIVCGQLERETALKTREAEANATLQERDDALQAQIQTASLARQREQQTVELELEERRKQLELTFQEKELDLLRTNQEIRNLTNERDLLRQLIARIPELAANLPDIHELKVLQTDGSSNAGLDTVTTFLARILAIAENFGISLKNTEQ